MQWRDAFAPGDALIAGSLARVRSTKTQLALALAIFVGAAAMQATPARAEIPGSTPVNATPEQLRETLYASELVPLYMLPASPEAPGQGPPGAGAMTVLALDTLEQKPVAEAVQAKPESVEFVNAVDGWYNEVDSGAQELAQNDPAEFPNLDAPIRTTNAEALGELRQMTIYADALPPPSSPVEAQADNAIKEAVDNLTYDVLQQVDGQGFNANWGDEPAFVGALNPDPLFARAAQQAEQSTLDDSIYASVLAGPAPDASLQQLQQAAGPGLQADVAAVAPSPEQGVHTTIGELRTQQGQAMQGLTVTAEGADADDHGVAEGIYSASVVGEKLRADDQQLVDESSESNFVTSGLEDWGDAVPAVEETSVATAEAGAEEIATIGIDTAVDVGASAVDPLMLAQLAFQGPQVISSLINLFTGAPSFEELVLEQLKAIEKQIRSLTEITEINFGRVDASLRGIDTTLNHDTTLLEHANENLNELSNDISSVQDKLDQIQADIFRIASTQREETFQAALNTDIGYTTQTEGAELPLYQYKQASGLFYTWGSQDPFNAISERPSEDWSTSPENIYAQLGTPTSENSLNFNLDYLAAFANEWDPQLTVNLPNPEVWAAGASAFSQLVFENPQYVTESQRTQLARLKSIGDELPPATASLAKNGEPQTVDGVTLDTGSNVVNHALAYYLQQATGPESSVLNRLQSEENSYLSTQDPGAAPGADPTNCTNCSLGIKPSKTEPGAELIDPWGGPEQAPNESGALTEFTSTSDSHQEEGGAGKGERIPGAMNACVEKDTSLGKQEEAAALQIPAESFILDPLPHVYANAWHLGLGKITTCYATKWIERREYSGDIEIALYWYWESYKNPGSNELVMELALQIDDGRKETSVLPGVVPFCVGANQSNSNAYFQAQWNFLQDKITCPSPLQRVFLEEALKRLAAHTPPQDFGLSGCRDDLKLANFEEGSFIPPETTELPACVARTASSSGIDSEVQARLVDLQEKIREYLAPIENEHRLNSSGQDFQAAAARLDGARALVDDYIELAMPGSMTSDPLLRALVLGGPKSGVESEEELKAPDESPRHLLDSSANDFEIYDYLQESHTGNPAHVLEENVTRRVEEIAAEVKKDLAAPGGTQVDPLVTGTLARLELTEDLLEIRPRNTAAPEVLGAPALGETLTCAPGTWKGAPAPSFSYEWLRAGTKIASGPSYVVAGEDVAHLLSCVVTASNGAGEVSASSAAVEIPPRPAFTIQAAQQLAGSTSGFTEEELAGQVGETVDYQITVHNTGNVPLTLANFSDANCAGVLGGPGLSALAIGQSTVFSCLRQLTGAGTYTNQASVEAAPPAGEGFPLLESSNLLKAHGPNPAPTVETGSASEVEQRSALLGASVNPRGKTLTSCAFQYGTSTLSMSAPCSSRPTGASAAPVSAAVRNLAPSTTYHFRISAGTSSATSSGSEGTFRTSASLPPAVETGAASAVGQRRALLNATVNPQGGAVGTCVFSYGTTTLSRSVSCAKLPGSGSSPVAVSAQLSELAPNTLYHYRISSSSPSGTSKGSEASFHTIEAFPPTVATEAASEVSAQAATLNAEVNSNGATVTSCTFEYGTSSLSVRVACGQLPGSGTAGVPVAARLKGLTANATYQFRITVSSASGTSKGALKTFRT